MGRISSGVQIVRTFGVRHGLLRLQYEISRGTAWMSLRMRPSQGWEAWSLTKTAPGTSAEELLAALRREGGRFFFSDCRRLAPELKKLLGNDGERAAMDEGYQVLNGRLPFFGRWRNLET